MSDKSRVEWVDEAREKLQKGFYSNNLKDLAEYFRQKSITTEWHSLCFILYKTFSAIVRSWDERPVTVQEVQAISNALSPILYATFDVLENSPGAEQQLDVMDQLILATQSLEI